MPTIKFSRRIESPRPEVFRLFSELEELPARINGIVNVDKLTEGAVGVGTRFRETRAVFGKESTEEMEFTDFRDNESYTVECDSHGTHYRSVYQFEPVGETTDVNVTFEARPVSLMARVMSPLGWLMMGATRKILEQDVDDLKKIAEKP